MKRLRSPEPNRKGIHEEHDVPERKVANLMARGWTEVATQRPQKAAEAPQKPSEPDTAGPLTESLQRRPVFDLSGSWFKTRKQVRDALGLDSAPGSKDEARVLLEDAGYEVTGA